MFTVTKTEGVHVFGEAKTKDGHRLLAVAELWPTSKAFDMQHMLAELLGESFAGMFANVVDTNLLDDSKYVRLVSLLLERLKPVGLDALARKCFDGVRLDRAGTAYDLRLPMDYDNAFRGRPDEAYALLAFVIEANLGPFIAAMRSSVGGLLAAWRTILSLGSAANSTAPEPTDEAPTDESEPKPPIFAALRSKIS